MTYVIVAAILGAAILLYFVLDKKEASLPAPVIVKPPTPVTKPPAGPKEKNGDQHEGDPHGDHGMGKDVGNDMGVDKK